MALEILREIHAPGLDLNEERMTKHRIFMDLIHNIAGTVAGWGWRHYREEGRGALYVNPDEWFELVSRQAGTSNKMKSFRYLRQGLKLDATDIGRLGIGYEEIVEQYDPTTMVVIVVNHASDFLSCYMALPLPSPRDAARFMAKEANAALEK